jgi:hypothetical protein
MKNNKRRLLKDLPFDNLKKGDVLYRVNGGFQQSRGETYYEGGSSSSNGEIGYEGSSEEILKTIWENADWFEDADLTHIDFVSNDEGILLRFSPIDQDDKEDLIKGLIHILPELEKGSFTWNKFKEITTGIKNN